MQLMTAQALARAVPDLTYSGYNIPAWGLSKGRVRNNRPPLPRIITQDIDLDAVIDMMKRGELPLAVLRVIALQVAFYGDVDAYRSLFPPLMEPAETAGEGEILINVRGAEILKKRSTVYGPVHVAYYERILEETGLAPVFLGQLGDDYNTELLKARFPQARFVHSRGAINDFEAIRNARHIVASVSSFSWLAAWLSHAETIHLPLLGLLNPQQRPDIALSPINDARYRFDLFPVREWVGSQAQIAELAGADPSRRIDTPELAGLLKTARDSRAEVRAQTIKALRRDARRALKLYPVLRRIYPAS